MPRMSRPRKKRFVVFSVSFPLPEGATVAAAREYVKDAVASMRGVCRPPFSYNNWDPGDPMFGLDKDAVEVHQIRANKKRR